MGPKLSSAAANKKRCDERNRKRHEAAAAKEASTKSKDTATHDEAKNSASGPAIKQSTVTDTKAANALPSIASHHAGFHQTADSKQEQPIKNTAADSDSESEWVMLDDSGEEVTPAIDCKV